MRRACLTLLFVGCAAPKVTPRASEVAHAVVAPPAAGPHAEARAFLERYCWSCHGGGKSKGGLALEPLVAQWEAPAHREAWQGIVERVAAREMPPDDAPSPSDREREGIAAWADATVLRLDCREPDPGRVTARRLNRVEYQATLRDLLGIDIDVMAELPVDNSGFGFDNVADALTMSPLLVERYLAVADRALDMVVYDPARAVRRRVRQSAEVLEIGQGARPRSGGVVLESNEEDDVAVTVDLPFDATYLVRVQAAEWKQPKPKPKKNPAPAAAKAEPKKEPPKPPDEEPGPPRLTFLVDDTAFDVVTVATRTPGVFEGRVRVPSGRHRIRAAVLRAKAHLPPDERLPKVGRRQVGQVIVHWLEIDGPLDAPKRPGPAHERLFGRPPAPGHERESARAALARFAARAYRRPPPDDEVDRLVSLAERTWAAGGTYEAGVRHAARAVLVSPRFLFRTDFDPDRGPPRGVAAIDDWALASRLSYFLWSSTPDDALFEEAARGTLRANLREQTARMLADPRSRALVDNFVGQWLELRRIDGATPAWFTYKTFNEALRRAMKRETELFFDTLIRDDRNVLDVLTADYTFVNERLAQHYGIEGVTGPDFRRVSLEGTPRRGVLGHASILTITSSSTRTSPVKRGKWVLEALLDAPPPPAPPDVPALEEGRKVKGTLRERLQQHRANPTCASCHARMDPIGFGLEPFDGIGALRTTDNGGPIDDTGTLTTGESFRGPRELADVLAASKKDAFLRAFAAKLLTYALGRGLGLEDRCTVDAVLAQAAAGGHHVRRFIDAVVASPAFLNTRGDDAPAAFAAKETRP